MEHIGEHFTILLRIRRHTQKPFKASREGTTSERAESGGQRAKGMHWAHGKLPECNTWQQTTHEGTEAHQMSETKRR